MEQLNYHKLINLRKRMIKYDCENSKKILDVINECIVIEKGISDKKDSERRSEYQFQDVVCDVCSKSLKRANIYKHKKTFH